MSEIQNKLYHLFFPDREKIPLRKLRWTILILIQELSKGKFRAVLKYYVKKSYRKDIQLLRDILSKGKLKSEIVTLRLSDVNYSHEITYYSWVIKLIEDLRGGGELPVIKVFSYNGRYIVIDGNHRLKAMKLTLSPDALIKARLLTYKY